MNQQSNCRPTPPGFSLFCTAHNRAWCGCLAEWTGCDRNGVPTGKVVRMQRATLDKLKEQQWQAGVPIPAVSLPTEAEIAPAEEPPPSGWRERPGLL